MKKTYLYILLEGEVDFRSLLKSNEFVLDSCVEHQARKVLVDFQTVTGLIQPMERFQFAEQLSLKYLQLFTEEKIKHCRFAYFGKAPQLDPERFGETVAINRGLTVMVTDDLRLAFEWLAVERDPAIS